VKLIGHLHLLATLRMSGVLPPSHIEILRDLNLTEFERIKNQANITLFYSQYLVCWWATLKV